MLVVRARMSCGAHRGTERGVRVEPSGSGALAAPAAGGPQRVGGAYNDVANLRRGQSRSDREDESGRRRDVRSGGRGAVEVVNEVTAAVATRPVEVGGWD